MGITAVDCHVKPVLVRPDISFGGHSYRHFARFLLDGSPFGEWLATLGLELAFMLEVDRAVAQAGHSHHDGLLVVVFCLFHLDCWRWLSHWEVFGWHLLLKGRCFMLLGQLREPYKHFLIDYQALIYVVKALL